MSYLDIQNTIYHEADIVFSDSTLIWYGDGHLFERVNICYSVNLQISKPGLTLAADLSGIPKDCHNGVGSSQMGSVYECPGSRFC